MRFYKIRYRVFVTTILLLAVSFSTSYVEVITGIVVTNTDDSGEGSLRWAIDQANSHDGPDTIVFNIPDADPGYNPETGVWTIQPDSIFSTLWDDSTTIDGTTQSAFIGSDTNPHGPEIEIDGTNAGDASGFWVKSAHNVIKGLVINRFGGDTWRKGRGVQLIRNSATWNVVVGCYIGTDATGMVALGNKYGGISIEDGASHNRIGGPNPSERNIISGATTIVNTVTGDGISIGEHATDDPEIMSSDNIVQGNYIGTNRDGTAALSNVGFGIIINRSTRNIIGGTAPGEGNLISGNTILGILIRYRTTTDNVVAGNTIGTDVSGVTDIGNGSHGLSIDYGAHDNIIGPGNIIAFNNRDGVFIDHDTTTGITVTENSITANTGMGINTRNGGNTELAPPSITDVSESAVSGTACPACIVEIFSDPEDEGAFYEGTTVADGSGNFSLSVSVVGPYVTATATDSFGNTSEFSTPAPLEECLRGDVNCDGNITPGDALCAFWRAILGSFQDECQCDCAEQAAEVNCDGNVTPGDALCIFWRAILGDWTEDCQCPAAKIMAVKQSDTRIKIGNLEGVRGEEVVVPIVVENPQDLDAFSLQLFYPSHLLEFVNISSAEATDEWTILEGRDTGSGWLIIGGFHTEGISSETSAPIVNVTFIVREKAVGAGALNLSNLTDDLSNAHVTKGSFTTLNAPSTYSLHQNYPNPFNPETEIMYQIADGRHPNHIVLSIYNILGRRVRVLVDEIQEAGSYTVTWDGKDSTAQQVPTGIYLYTLSVNGNQWSQTRRMMLIR